MYTMYANASKNTLAYTHVSLHVKISSPCILKCKAIMWRIPMSYSKYHDVDIFSLKGVNYIDEWESYWQLVGITLWEL